MAKVENGRSVIAAATLVGCGASALFANQAARTDEPAPTFEVALVRLNREAGPTSFYTTSPGRLTVINYPLQFVISRAYGIELPLMRFKLTGGSERLLSERVDINATAPPETSEDQVQLMLRQLLAERFKLRIRTESTATDVYELVLDRDGQFGPDFNRSAHNCEDAYARLRAENKRPIDGVAPPRDAKGRALCWILQAQDPTPAGGFRVRNAGDLEHLILNTQAFVDRPIVDRTGLKGNFEWQLIFSLNPIGATEWSSIFTAFVDQLGLRLRSATVPYEVFRIDSIEVPSEQ